jgi:serine/threonine protein kinase
MGTLGVDRDVAAALGIVRQMTAAIAHCHSLRIAVGHDALDVANFMWADAQQTTVQLAVLPGAQVLSPTAHTIRLHPQPVTHSSPPESLGLGGVGDTVVDPFAADVWALGVAAYIMLAGDHPFGAGGESADSPRGLAARIRAGASEPPAGLAPAVLALIAAMLTANPAKRISAATALDHPAFADRRHWLATSLPCGPRRRESCPSMMASACPRGLSHRRRDTDVWCGGVAEVPETATPVATPPTRRPSKRQSFCADLDRIDFSNVKRRSSLN